MATIEAALTAAVTGDPTVGGLIGARFFLFGSRQNPDPPYATYQRISTPGAAFLDGDANLEWPRFQIDVWSKDPLESLTIAEAIRAFLCPTPSANRTGAGISFSASFQDQDSPEIDEITRNFRCRQDYFLTYSRS